MSIPILRQLAIDMITGRITLTEPELANERIKVCEACPEFRKMTRTCSVCNCFMDMKTKIVRAACPVDKW